MAVKKASKTPAKAKTKSVPTKGTAKKVAAKPASKKSAAKAVPKKTAAKAPAKVAAKAPAKTAVVVPKKAAAKAVSARPAAPPPPKPAPVKAAPAKPTPPRPTSAGLDKAFLAEQRQMLQTERAVYLAQAEEYEAEADMLARELETGDVGFDEEAGEGGAATVDRERDLVLSAQARQTVADIDAAVKRMSAGKYGLCTRCGQKIPRMRLKAIPHTDLCVDCKSGGLLRRR